MWWDEKCPCCNYQGNMTRMYDPIFSVFLTIVPVHFYRCPKCKSYYLEQMGIRTIIHDEKLKSRFLCKQ